MLTDATSKPYVPAAIAFVERWFAGPNTHWPSAIWRWDARFHCALTTLEVGGVDAAQSAILGIMPDLYDHVRVAQAPPGLRRVATRVGGIRSGQMLFGGVLEDESLVFALWWPWDDGRTISVRIGLADVEGSIRG